MFGYNSFSLLCIIPEKNPPLIQTFVFGVEAQTS